MCSYKCRVQTAASSLPCAHRVQGEYCRCFEMGFTCTIAAALSRHIQKWKTHIFTNLSKRFFSKLFLKEFVSSVLHPLILTSHLILLSFYHGFLYRYQQGWQSKRAHTCTCTHTPCTETQMHKHFQQQPAEQGMHTPQVADIHSIPQERQKDTMASADVPLYTCVEPGAQPDTPAHQSSPLPPAHTHGSFGAVPLHQLMMLSLKLCSSWKGCIGERRRVGKGFLVIFCTGIFLLLFWQTRIPFELINFFLPRISNDNA